MKVFFLVALQFSQVISQGAPWTEEDALAVKKKLIKVFTSNWKVAGEYYKLHPNGKRYQDKTKPNAPKMLRLGFHDCLKYDGEMLAGEVNGCDGCLNPTGMGVDMIKKFGAEKGSFAGPDITLTNNNGLMFTADILEEIYTNPTFPKKTPIIKPSLKMSNKSRADLWAFAATVALEWGIEGNNLACEGNTRNACGHLRRGEPNCKIQLATPITFQTGRRDCVTELDSPKPYFSVKHEIHPNTHGNGRDTADFYKDNFGFTAREAIAIMGAHSFGKFNSNIALFRYRWTRAQDGLINNQLYRHIAGKPQYFSDCKPSWRLVGDSTGAPGNTSWLVRASWMSENGGPFLWFHMYHRCPASNNCSAIDQISRAEPDTPAHCCENLQPEQQCQPDCVRWIANDETALPAELGFYYKFNSNKTTGKPFGCNGFDAPTWTLENWKKSRGKKAWPECGLEDYAPDGEKLHEIVEEYAEYQEDWISEFVPAFEKMLANGYQNLERSSSSLIDGPTRWYGLQNNA